MLDDHTALISATLGYIHQGVCIFHGDNRVGLGWKVRVAGMLS